MFHINFWFVPILLLLLSFNTSYASLEDDSNTIFNWAEQQYPQYFSPVGQITKAWDIWYYRFYPDTGIYVGVNNQSQVHVMGGEFGGSPFLVGTVSDFMTIINNSSGYIINSGNGNCVREKLTAVGTVMITENLPMQSLDLSVDTTDIPESILGQLTPEQQALFLEQLSESLQTDYKFRETETVLESTLTRYKTEAETITESQVGGNTIKYSTHSIGSVDTYISNEIMYVSKYESAYETESNSAPRKASYDLVSTPEPHTFGGPAYQTCEGQSWYTAPVIEKTTGSQTIDGVTAPMNYSNNSTGLTFVVEAINESLTVPAGTFNTVRWRETSDYNNQPETYSITWSSIEHGVIVKSENYTNGKLRSGTHLTSLSQ